MKIGTNRIPTHGSNSAFLFSLAPLICHTLLEIIDRWNNILSSFQSAEADFRRKKETDVRECESEDQAIKKRIKRETWNCDGENCIHLNLVHQKVTQSKINQE